MDALIRSKDWTNTPLGPMATWSPSLQTMVSFMLANRFPLLLWWGPDYISIYNDAYRPVLGAKHPWGLGKPARECWSEIWDVLRPLIDAPFHGGPATWSEDLLLEINRHGFVEESHFTVAYSPVPDASAPGGIGGVLATVHEITEKVIGERRIMALRDLASNTMHANTVDETCMLALAALQRHPLDIPFALVYLFDDSQSRAHLVATAGIRLEAPAAPSTIALSPEEKEASAWPLWEVLRRKKAIKIVDLAERFASVPPGPWSDSPNTAVLLPLPSSDGTQLRGVLIAGLSSRLKEDERYLSFFELISAQIAAAMATAKAYEAAQERAETLAEIDRAKTAFFSNVSHEFRTPLTLMLGPLSEAIDSPHLPYMEKQRLELAHRNALRLLKLVNSLLDFSRIEAGRAQTHFQITDLGSFTEELTSNFRSVCEHAGLRLLVDCGSLSKPVQVDRDMWEKIVINLLSNAFKFTFDGEISVRLNASGNLAVLTVQDTGVGIPHSELPHLFERFHRIEGQRGRTYEGTGIGLALVHELVKLHEGSIHVESEVGVGTCFKVSLPLQQQVRSVQPASNSPLEHAPIHSKAYVEEALSWLPESSPSLPPSFTSLDRPPRQLEHTRVVVADDNADMRNYIVRLLGPTCDVVAVGDGEAALQAIHEHHPDLVITDAMMPVMDGIELVRAIRNDPATAEVPIVMLSARAGEEDSVEGLEAGVDDYLVKPFSARELIARVSTTLKLSQARRHAADARTESERRYRELIEALPAAVYTTDASGYITYSNQAANELAGREPILGRDTWSSVWRLYRPNGTKLPPEQSPLALTLKENRPIRGEETVTQRPDGTPVHLIPYPTPLRDKAGHLIGAINMLVDISERKKIEDALRKNERQLRAYLDTSFDAVYRMSPDWSAMHSLKGKGFISDTFEKSNTWLDQYIPVNERARVMHAIQEAVRTKSPFALEHAVIQVDGSLGWTSSRAVPLLDSHGEILEWFGTATDITQRKQHEERQQLLLNELNHRVKNTLAAVHSIVLQTLRNSKNAPDARALIGDRLAALSQAHDILTQRHWEGALLSEVILHAVKPNLAGANERVQIAGSDVWVPPKFALALSLAFHELCTNAIKYGALSNDSGRVQIEWTLRNKDNTHYLQLRWEEFDGPPVTPPTRMGFGSRLIERGLRQDLDGEVKVDYAPEGLVCTIHAHIPAPAIGGQSAHE
ncbi:ATP-binding protein [Dyella acidiphila]|nr:ATP-binding protein [Dyella acidiphila]